MSNIVHCHNFYLFDRILKFCVLVLRMPFDDFVRLKESHLPSGHIQNRSWLIRWGELLPKLTGLHYHNVLDPAWFSLWDFKVLIMEKPGGIQRPAYRESKGFRWYSQR